VTGSALGHVLLVVGCAWLALVVLVDGGINGFPPGGATRVTGRVLNRLLGPLTRPLRRVRPRVGVTVTLDAAVARELRAAYGRPPLHPRCARRGHRATWNGYHEVCRRCGARHEHVSRGGEPWHWEWNRP
jgi:hypothetical protein